MSIMRVLEGGPGSLTTAEDGIDAKAAYSTWLRARDVWTVIFMFV